VYWLRRIPTETRIVVLVVFLALFQAILLSVFGLGAIRGERRKAEENLRQYAENFLRQDLARRCDYDLRATAEEAALSALNGDHEEWSAEPLAGGGLFTDFCSLAADGSILTSAGLPLWLPREVAERREEEGRTRFSELTREFADGLIGEHEKGARDLGLARRYPFVRGEGGEALSLLYAATPLLAGEGAAPAQELLRVRWIGALNRVEGIFAAASVERFLAQVDAAGRGNAAYQSGRREQQRREKLLRALVLERPHLSLEGGPALHRNVRAGKTSRFFVRPVGKSGEIQVLAVDPARLKKFLDQRVRAAARQAQPGVRPELVETPVRSGGGRPQVAIEGLPGWTATARISAGAIRDRARKRERFYWYIIAFSVTGILAGGLLTARVVMREMRLAKLKSGFVSNVSHSLKTPLTSIRMFTEMLRAGKIRDEAERNECLEVIEQEATRLGSLIQQVLDFGKLSSRRRRFRWVSGPLGKLLREEALRFRRTTGLDGDAFRLRLAVNTPPVTFDPDRMREVVANLLFNAYKYTDPQKRRIEAVLGPHRGRVVFAVEDNGPGIRARERRRIFEQFYRSKDLLAREVEGTGLGLSIARSIVRAHGGRIFVEDSSLGGSRFVVVLPAARLRAGKKERVAGD